MTGDEIRAWMSTFLEPAMHDFGLGWWRVNVAYKDLEPGVSAVVHVRDEYERATIDIDEAQCAAWTTDEFRSVIEHELLHITQAPFMNLHAAIEEHLPEAVKALAGEWFHDAKERNIRHLERLVQAVRG